MADDQYNIAKRDYSKYFYKKNGKWYISSEGIKEFNTTKPTTGLYSFTKEAKTPKFEESSFKTFMKELGVSYIGNQISFRDANRVGTIWGNYIENSPESKRSKYDATKSTEYDYTYSSVDAKDVKKSIAEALAGNEDPKLQEVQWNGKNFVATGNTLALSDLNKDEYSITSSRMKGRDNNTVMIKDDDGNVKRYRMPVGINTTNENNRDVELEWAEILRNHPNGGEIRIPDSYARANGLKIGTTINASAEQVQTEYTRAISSAYKYHSQLGVQNTTSSQTFKPFAY